MADEEFGDDFDDLADEPGVDPTDDPDAKFDDIVEAEPVESDDEDAEPEEEDTKVPDIEQVDTIAKTSRDHRKVIIVEPNDRITSNVLQLMEASNIIAKRAAQIEQDARVFTDVTGLHDPIEMAKKELKDRKCPLILRRRICRKPTQDGNFDVICEDWNVREMTLPEL